MEKPSNHHKEWKDEEINRLKQIVQKHWHQGLAPEEAALNMQSDFLRKTGAILGRMYKEGMTCLNRDKSYRWNKKVVAGSAEIKEEEQDICANPAVFDGYSFKWHPQSVIGDAIKETLIEPHLIEENSEGALLAVPFPTGSGKTYNTLLMILYYMLKCIKEEQTTHFSKKEGLNNYYSSQNRIVVYTVDTIDNVKEAKSDLTKLINGDLPGGPMDLTKAQRAYLVAQLCHIPSHTDTLCQTPIKAIERAMNLLEIDPKGEYVKEIKNYQKIQTVPTQYREVIERASKKPTEQLYATILNAIRNQIKRKFGNDRNGKYEYLKNNAVIISALIPGVGYEAGLSRVLFMTTSKFLTGFHMVSRIEHLDLDKNTERLFWIVDEFDRQSAVILKHHIQERAIALLETTKVLTTAVLYNRISLTNGSKRLHNHIARLKISSKNIRKKWNISSSLHAGADIPQEKYAGGRIFLDSGRVSTMTSLRGDERYQYIKEPSQITNWLKITSKEKIDSDKDFIYFVDDCIKYIYQTFPYALLAAAENAARAKADPDKPTSEQIQEEVEKIIKYLALTNLKVDIWRLLKEIQFRSSQRVVNDILINYKKNSYHDNGFTLTSFFIDPHPLVDVKTIQLAITPTKYIQKLIMGNAVILGISATALARTSANNFDIGYLKRSLKSRFLEFNEKQIRDIQDYWRRERNYENVKITINEAKQYDIDPLIKKIIIEGKMDETIDSYRLKAFGAEKRNNHAIKRIQKLLFALDLFIKNPKLKYFVGFMNFHTNGEKYKKLEALILDAIGKMSREVKVTTPFIIQGVKSATLREDLARATERLQKGHKVILLTTYKSMGAGTNANYEYNPEIEEDDLIIISDLKKNINKLDIDSVYIEKPAYLLPIPSADTTSSEEIRVYLCHAVMSLCETGDFSKEQQGPVKNFV